MLVLLVARNDERETLDWAKDVLSFAETDDYVDGEAWKSPECWSKTRQDLSYRFHTFLRNLKLADARAIEKDLKRHNLPPSNHSQITNYVSQLFAKPREALLGMGGGNAKTSNHGVPLRRVYLMPRVARLVRDALDETKAALDDAREAVHEEEYAKKRRVEKIGPSPSKCDVKQERDALAQQLAEQQQAAARTAEAHRKSQARLHGARAESRMDRKRLETEAAARADAAAASTRASLEAKLEAALARERELRKEITVSRAAAQRLKRKRSDPTRLRVLEGALARERKDNHALRVEMEKSKDKIAELHEKIKDLLATIEDSGTVELFRRRRGKGAGRGLPHGPKLRRLYQELLSLNLFPSTVNAAIVKARARDPKRPACARRERGARACRGVRA